MTIKDAFTIMSYLGDLTLFWIAHQLPNTKSLWVTLSCRFYDYPKYTAASKILFDFVGGFILLIQHEKLYVIFRMEAFRSLDTFT